MTFSFPSVSEVMPLTTRSGHIYPRQTVGRRSRVRDAGRQDGVTLSSPYRFFSLVGQCVGQVIYTRRTYRGIVSDTLRNRLHALADAASDIMELVSSIREMVPDTPSLKDVTPSTKSCTPSLPSGPESLDSHSESSCGGELKDGSSVQAAVYPRKSKQP